MECDSLVNAFTVDVEDYFQVSAYDAVVSRAKWKDFPSRVKSNTMRILDLVDGAGIKGTFFVLGWVADEYPELVREIHDRGHELGCHSYWHRLVYEQSPEEFREDLIDCRRAIEDASGIAVTSYRAPSFSVIKESLWAIDILAEEGFTVDSSIYPVYHDRYGIPDQPTGIHDRETAIGVITEFPPSVCKVAGYNLPISGGGYFRLYPYLMTKMLLARTVKATQQPFMFYIHPWEVDPDQPKIKHPSKAMYFRHRVGLRRTETKLCRLLRDFRFGTITESINSARDVERQSRPIAPEDSNPSSASIPDTSGAKS